MLPKFNECNFDAWLWRNGNPFLMFGFHLRHDLNKRIIKKYAIGYCDAERLTCRPKPDHKAVMFYYNNELGWFHLTNKEFSEVFDV